MTNERDDATALLVGLIDVSCWRGTRLEARGAEFIAAMRYLNAVGRLHIVSDDGGVVVGQWAQWPERPSRPGALQS